MTLEAGTFLGHYRVLALLGRGGMADVYRAVDERLGREVALKALPPELARDPDRVRRFEQEVRAAAGLTHPGIVTVYEYGSGDGHHFYTMALMAGGDLRSRIRSNPGGLSVEEAREVVVALAVALGYAHGQGFVHRDVKPENVLFGWDGRPQLADFGIARAMSAGALLTEDGLMIGSPHYVSPEQARAQRVDGRSDLYSLGIVLHEMLTGRVPFDAVDSMAVLYAQVNEPPPPLPAALASWQPVLDRLLAKEPDARYGTANDLLAELAPGVSWSGAHSVAQPVSTEAVGVPAPEGGPPAPATGEGGTRFVMAAQTADGSKGVSTPVRGWSQVREDQSGDVRSGRGSSDWDWWTTARRWVAKDVERLRLAAVKAWLRLADSLAPERRQAAFVVAGVAAMVVAVVVGTLPWARNAGPSEREAGGSGGSEGGSLAESPATRLASPFGSGPGPQSGPPPVGTPSAVSVPVFAAFDPSPANSDSAAPAPAPASEPSSRALSSLTAASEPPFRPSAPELPPRGFVDFEIVPPDATVILEAENRRLSSGDSLVEGTHRLKIGRDGYLEIVRAVRVTADEVVPVRVELEPVAEPDRLVTTRRAAVVEVPRAVAEVPRRQPETLAERPTPAESDRPREPPGRGSTVLTDRLGSGGAGPAMVVVPAGAFRMGCLNDEGGCRNEELPARTVKVSSFALARHEVTRGDFSRFQAATGRDMGGGCRVYNGKDWTVERDRNWRDSGRDQVVCVTWEDAAAYAAWLSSETGERYRLPSEAEWEYVARRTGELGVENMVGSVWEWAADCWRPNYKGAPSDGSAVARRRCKDRVMRGGSWLNGPALQTPSYRLRILGEERFNNVGFRVARDVSW